MIPHYFIINVSGAVDCRGGASLFAAHTLTGAPHREHIAPILQDLHWLPVRCRVIFKMLTLMYKVKYGIAPAYLSELVEHYKPGRMLHSSSLDDHKFVELPTSLVTPSPSISI